LPVFDGVHAPDDVRDFVVGEVLAQLAGGAQAGGEVPHIAGTLLAVFRLAVQPEENSLANQHTGAYIAYRGRVRRWL
jgi:protein-S-isoprenylcysteine O-methyltransferase Ste14